MSGPLIISRTLNRCTLFIHLFSLLAVFTAILVLQGCSGNKEKKQDHLTEIEVGITSSFLGEAATFIAKDRGFFEEYGLDVTLRHNLSGSVSIRDLFNRTVDIAHVAETPVVYALMDTSYYKCEVPSFQILTNMIITDEIQKIIARKDHGIDEPRDLKGKKVAIYQGTQLDYYLDSFLLEYQISKDTLTLVDLDPVSQVEAIKSGAVDVAVTWEPYATYIQHLLGDQAVTFQTELTYSTLWLITTLDSFANSHPEILTSYLKAVRKSQIYIKNHPEQAQKILSEQTDVPLEIVRALWEEIDFDLTISKRLLTLFDDQARWLKSRNVADTANLNFENFINFGPMQEVHPDGITVIQ